jgi:hypothetical protein
MAAWSIISNTSSLIQLLGAGICAARFLLARTNLTAANRKRAQWVQDGHQLALELLDCSQRNEPIPPALLSRFESYVQEAITHHATHVSPMQGMTVWSGNPDSILLTNLEHQQIVTLGLLANQLKSWELLGHTQSKVARSSDLLVEKLAVVESKILRLEQFIDQSHVTNKQPQMRVENSVRDQSIGTYGETTISARLRRRKAIQRPPGVQNYCSCACHSVITIRGRTWNIHLQDPRRLSVCTCMCRVFGIKAWYSNSRLQAAFILDFSVTWSNGLTICPTIRMAPIVPFTSPGFILANKLECGIVTQQEAKHEFRRLFSECSISHLDTNPQGQTLLEVSLENCISINIKREDG